MSDEGSYRSSFLAHRYPSPEWRNWQTRRIQNPVSRKGSGGSIPPSGIDLSWQLVVRRNAAMPRCATCDEITLWGGVKAGPERYCNSHYANILAAYDIPDDILDAATADLHAGPCPCCGRIGSPVDVHRACSIYSVILITRGRKTRRVSCHRCARKQQTLFAFGCATFGWWGLPHGADSYTRVHPEEPVGFCRSSRTRLALGCPSAGCPPVAG
jgi:hypothetical protein